MIDKSKYEKFLKELCDFYGESRENILDIKIRGKRGSLDNMRSMLFAYMNIYAGYTMADISRETKIHSAVVSNSIKRLETNINVMSEFLNLTKNGNTTGNSY